MTSHDLAVPDESRGRQAFVEGISHHFARAQRHKFEEAIQYEITHIVLTNVNMTGELSDEDACIRNRTDKIATPETCNLNAATLILTTLIQRLCSSLCP